MLATFLYADSLVKTHLFRSFCLSLYGAPLWQLSSKALKSLEVSFNKILRRIWPLPPDSHTSIVHCTSYLSSVFNLVYSRCSSLIHRACISSSYVVKLLVIVILFVVSITCMAVALLESTPILICHMVTLFTFFISFTGLLHFHAMYVILSLFFQDISQCTFTVSVY